MSSTAVVEPRAAVPGASASPAPGVHADVPFAEYVSWKGAVSNSQLTKLQRSPAHLQAYLAEPPEETQALRLGHAIHTAVLEPERFAEEFANVGAIDRRTTAGKAAWAACEAKGQVPLKDAEYEGIVGVRNALLAHPYAGALLTGEGGRNELSLVWDDAATGLRCKARHDRHSPGIAGGAIIDVKTTVDARQSAFERAIFAYGYHRQGAMYLDGAAANGIAAEHYVIIAVEKVAPFAIGVYRLTEAAIEAGREELRALLKTYEQCVRLDYWPGYPAEVRDITLPDWAWNVSASIADGVQG